MASKGGPSPIVLLLGESSGNITEALGLILRGWVVGIVLPQGAKPSDALSAVADSVSGYLEVVTGPVVITLQEDNTWTIMLKTEDADVTDDDRQCLVIKVDSFRVFFSELGGCRFLFLRATKLYRPDG